MSLEIEYTVTRIPTVRPICLEILLSISYSALVTPSAAAVCNLYYVADVAHHRRACRSIVVVLIWCCACVITLCRLACVVRIAAPHLLRVIGAFNESFTPRSLW